MSERFKVNIEKNNPNVAHVVDEKTGITALVQTSISDDINDVSIYVSRLDRPICLTLEDKKNDEEKWISVYKDIISFMIFGKETNYAEQEDTSMDESEQHGRRARPDYHSYT